MVLLDGAAPFTNTASSWHFLKSGVFSLVHVSLQGERQGGMGQGQARDTTAWRGCVTGTQPCLLQAGSLPFQLGAAEVEPALPASGCQVQHR